MKLSNAFLFLVANNAHHVDIASAASSSSSSSLETTTDALLLRGGGNTDNKDSNNSKNNKSEQQEKNDSFEGFDVATRSMNNNYRELASGSGTDWSLQCEGMEGRTHEDRCSATEDGSRGVCCDKVVRHEDGSTSKLACSKKYNYSQYKRCHEIHSDDINWSQLCYVDGGQIEGEECSSEAPCCNSFMTKYDDTGVEETGRLSCVESKRLEKDDLGKWYFVSYCELQWRK